MFAAPVAGWISRREYREFVRQNATLPGFTLQDAVPEFAKSVCLLLAGYILLRWLYFEPPTQRVTTDNLEASD